MKQQIIECIKENKIIAIVRGVDKNDILPVAKALYEGGIRLIEVTFNQKDPDHLEKTPELIRIISETMGDRILAGAGTVMNEAQCRAAYEAGAGYIISPNYNIKVVHMANELGAVSIPGALTPSEAVQAYEAGADFVKLFPAGDLGTGYIKSVCSPLNHIPFLAVGGVNAGNVPEFLRAGALGVGVGGNLVDTKVIRDGRFWKLTELAKEYTERLK